MEVKKVLVIIFILISGTIHAQDALFTQFTAIPMYLNPGLTGSTLEYRASMISRVQWPGAATKPFFTNAIGFDYNNNNLNSGFGALITTDMAGESRYRSTTANLLYSFRIATKKGWIIRPGLNFGVGVRDIQFDNLVFGNQLNLRGQNDQVITDDTYVDADERVSYFDFGTGAVMYNQKVWFGGAIFHLNQPNISMVEGDDQLPLRWTLHGGITFPLYNTMRKDKTIPELAPTFLYQNQGKFDQLDVGLYVYYASFQFGLWYRGLPVAEKESWRGTRIISSF
jgi:type IX secretion system PorP/SprF family membrane protein